MRHFPNTFVVLELCILKPSWGTRLLINEVEKASLEGTSLSYAEPRNGLLVNTEIKIEIAFLAEWVKHLCKFQKNRGQITQTGVAANQKFSSAFLWVALKNLKQMKWNRTLPMDLSCSVWTMENCFPLSGNLWKIIFYSHLTLSCRHCFAVVSVC